MGKIINKIITSLILIKLFFFMSVFPVNALSFSDNFDTEEGGFPSRWEHLNPSTPCSANWITENGMLKILIENQGSCAMNIVPKDSEWPNIGSSFVFDVDMFFINGTDHNVVYNTNSDFTKAYEIHFQSPGDFVLGYPSNSQIVFSKNKNYYNGQKYHVRVKTEKKNLKIYVNDELVREVILDQELLPGKIALRAGTGGDPNSETWFDNVKVSSINDYDSLDVDDIKQTTFPWANMEYDSANRWSPTDPTISSWGCAITSANMILSYQGYKKLPDGTLLDPGSLNNWLKNQPDGYLKNGWLNWLALTRLTMQSKSINQVTRFDALEYEKILTEDKELLTNDIKNDMPDILEVPNHFVVAKGISGDTFIINDPSYSDRLDLTSYSNNFITLGRYIPSSTDLSYFMVVSNNNFDIKMKDSYGNYIGQQFIQNSMVNDSNNIQKNGDPIKTYYFKKPNSGDYKLEISSSEPNTYTVDLYFYNISGEVKKMFQQGVSNVTPSLINIYLDKNDLNNIKKSKVVSFEILINDIKYLHDLRLLNAISEKMLTSLTRTSQKQYGKNSKKQAKQLLKATEILIRSLPDELILKDAKIILLEDIFLLNISL
ncbi:C39 family peptidase [Patescibacteria group bacterium]|nr:C39 family peptidase [Patescibacteria group bacterium]